MEHHQQDNEQVFTELREREVRLAIDNEVQHGPRWQAVISIGAKISCVPQTPNDWVTKAEVDSCERPCVFIDIAERMKVPKRENRELRQGNKILPKTSAYFCDGEAQPPIGMMAQFIDDHRFSAWGLADLQRSPNRPCHLLRASGQGCQSGAIVSQSQAR